MKKIFIVFLLFMQGSIFSQIDEIIHDLQSEDAYRNVRVIPSIIFDNIYETYPYLQDLYHLKPVYVQTEFIKALNHFNDPEVRHRANALLERLDNLNEDESFYIGDLLSKKVQITEILVSQGQYNTINYVFDIISRDGIENINPTAYNLLERVLYEIPEYEQQAKNVFMEILLNNSDQDRRGITIGILSRRFGTEMIETLRTRFVSDDSVPVRFMSLKYLLLLDKENLHDFLVSKIQANKDWTFELEIIDTLLSVYGKPSDLKLFIDYCQTERNAISKEIISFRINSFIPSKPNIGIELIIDSLINYTKQLYEFNWIKDSKIYKEYLIELENQKQLYIEKDEDKLNDSIGQFLETVEEHHKAKLLTDEGYKYLHYYATYIKEEVEEEF